MEAIQTEIQPEDFGRLCIWGMEERVPRRGGHE
jgi:hypothetical protein